MSIVLKCLIEGVQGIQVVKGDKEMSLYEILKPHIPENITPDRLDVKREKEVVGVSSALPVSMPLSLINLSNGEVIEVKFKAGRPMRKLRVKIMSRHTLYQIPPKIITVSANETLAKILTDNIPGIDLSTVSVTCLTREIRPDALSKTILAALSGTADNVLLTIINFDPHGDLILKQSSFAGEKAKTPDHAVDNKVEQQKEEIIIKIPEHVPSEPNEIIKEVEKVEEVEVEDEDEGKEGKEIMNENQEGQNEENIIIQKQEVPPKKQPNKKYTDADPFSLIKQMKENKTTGNNNNNNNKERTQPRPRYEPYVPPERTESNQTSSGWDENMIRNLVSSAKAEKEEKETGMARLATIDPEKGDPFELTSQDLAAIILAKKHMPSASEIERMAKTRKMGTINLKITDNNNSGIKLNAKVPKCVVDFL